MSILKMKQQQHDINFWGGLGKKNFFFEKVNFDPYNFRITILSARKSEQMKNF